MMASVLNKPKKKILKLFLPSRQSSYGFSVTEDGLTQPPTTPLNSGPTLQLLCSPSLLLLLPTKTNNTLMIKLLLPSTNHISFNRKMKYPPLSLIREHNILFLRGFMILFLSCITIRLNFCISNIPSSLETLPIEGHFNFDQVSHAARDFGNRYRYRPMAVLHPKSVTDIAVTIRHIWEMGPRTQLTVAARGHGHSLQGQAQAHGGVVINMESLKVPEVQVHVGDFPYVDVPGGELWINILHESLRYGLAPRSWTDYLHLTVGGTLSNAGISGQAFRHGPQISNVQQLEIVTGTGEVVKCSKEHNIELFHSVLGGLGQFGIITRARILLEPAHDLHLFNREASRYLIVGPVISYPGKGYHPRGLTCNV